MQEFTSRNPANDDIVWQGAAASSEEVSQAIVHGKRAFIDWSRESIQARVSILRAFVSCLESQKEAFAEAISREMGKPLWESKSEVQTMLRKIPVSIDAFEKRCAESVDASGVHTRFKPHGVVAVFGPFNFPGHLPNGHIVPALLAGNAVVFKPSEQTPFVGEYLGRVWNEAGLPKGVLSVVQGAKDTGISLTSHQDIDGVFFTGSSQTGKAIHRAFAGRPDVILALEMGGNNPLVVWGEGDIHAQVYTIIQSAFITSGQRCTCARRLIIEEGERGDEIVEALSERASRITVAAYDASPEPFMGPVIDVPTGEKIQARWDAMLSAGGVELLKLRVNDNRGNMLSPGVVDVTNIPDREDAEIFGPVLQVIRVPTLEAAIAECNATSFGLSAALLTADESLFTIFQERVRAGVINWNKATTGASSSSPFGGIRDSGNHRPSAYFAADYCSYPTASATAEELSIPENKPPGLDW